MKPIPVKVTYLQMFTPPEHNMPEPHENVMVVQAERPTIAFCRFLNDAVGGQYNWVDRTLLCDEELAQIVHDRQVETHVLYVEGTPAGFAELDRREAEEIELAYFGIMPEFIGQGLGRFFLHWAIDRAWSYHPKRLWVHTCDLDHEAALPLYRKSGFEVYDEQTIEQPIP